MCETIPVGCDGIGVRAMTTKTLTGADTGLATILFVAFIRFAAL